MEKIYHFCMKHLILGGAKKESKILQSCCDFTVCPLGTAQENTISGKCKLQKDGREGHEEKVEKF